MKKRLIAMLSIFVIMLGFTAPAYATRVVLTVPGYQQGSSNGWCWAACDKMIIQYLNDSSPSLQTLVQKYGQSSDGGANIATARKALNDYDITNSLQYNCLSYTAVKSQINNSMPMFCQLQNGDGWVYGHCDVIRGYDTSDSTVLYLDPTDGCGHKTTYSEFCDGCKWDGNYSEWNATIFSNHV